MTRGTLVGAVAMLAVASGCARTPAAPSAKPLHNEIHVVGRIELVPPLAADEQELRGIGSGRQRQRGYLFLSDRFLDLSSPGMSAGRHAVHVELNKDFVVKRRAFDEMHYSGVTIMLGNTSYLNLPGGAVYNLTAADKAIYIGTLRYHRDVYNTITRVEYVDDYQRALAFFRKQTGQTGMSLRKVAPAKPRQG